MIEYKNMVEVLEKIGETITTQYKEQLKSKRTYSTGKLYNSIKYKLIYTDDGVKLEFVAEDYFVNIEKGRPAGGKMPSITAIKKWMITRGIPDKDNTAYLIARKIARKGIKAKPYLREIQNKLPNYAAELTAALDKDIRNSINKRINDNNNKLSA